MDTIGTRAEVDRILDASLGELTQQGGVSGQPAQQLAAWHLPEQGRLALGTFGLPPARTDELMGVGGLQESEKSGQGPSSQRIYLIGSYGSSRLAAVEETGEVLAIPATSRVHSDLAHLYPSGILPTMVNSTIIGLVECAWRWHSILPLLAAEQDRAGEVEIAAWTGGRVGEEMPEPYAGYQELCKHVLRRFRDIDPTIGNEAGFWVDVIIDVS